MLHFTKKEYGTEEYCVQFEEHEDMDAIMNTREIRDGGIGGRAIEADVYKRQAYQHGRKSTAD